MLIRPREARARRGYGSAPDGAQPRFIILLPSAAQPSPRSGSVLSRHRRFGCGQRSAPPLAAAAQPASPRRVVLAVPTWIHLAPCCRGSVPALCAPRPRADVLHCVDDARSGPGLCSVSRLALARRARGVPSWTHQKKRGPTAATSCPSGTASSSSVIGSLSSPPGAASAANASVLPLPHGPLLRKQVVPRTLAVCGDFSPFAPSSSALLCATMAAR